MNNRQPDSKDICNKLDHISNLLQDLFILDACNTGMKKEEVRKILRIDKKRITRISRHIPKEKQAD